MSHNYHSSSISFIHLWKFSLRGQDDKSCHIVFYIKVKPCHNLIFSINISYSSATVILRINSCHYFTLAIFGKRLCSFYLVNIIFVQEKTVKLRLQLDPTILMNKKSSVDMPSIPTHETGSNSNLLLCSSSLLTYNRKRQKAKLQLIHRTVDYTIEVKTLIN